MLYDILYNQDNEIVQIHERLRSEPRLKGKDGLRVKTVKSVPKNTNSINKGNKRKEQENTGQTLAINSNQSAILILIKDGIGGTLARTDTIRKISKRHSNRDIIVTAKPVASSVLENLDYIDHVVSTPTPSIPNGKQIVYDLQSYVARTLPDSSMYWNNVWKHYWGKDKIKDLRKLHLHHVDITNRSLELESEGIKLDIYQEPIDLSIKSKYIVIMPGTDPNMKNITKTWEHEKWIKLVNNIKTPVIQLGLSTDEYVDGTVDMRGETNIHQAAYVISNAEFIICIEGAGHHIAKAVDTPAYVLTGPTPPSLFVYYEQSAIDTEPDCRCFGLEGWNKECRTDVHCMKDITVEQVLETI